MSNEPLFANEFKRDPRVRQAKDLLIQALQEHQKDITSVRPPHSELIETYSALIQSFNHIRGANLYFPYISSGFGKGPLVELLDGSIKYDMINGVGVHYWGHSHPDIISQSMEVVHNDTIMQGNLQQNIEALEFCKLLKEASGLDHCFLTTSGAMANENALKVIFQNKFPARRILAFEHCFAGRSLTLSQITDKPAYREGIPLNLPVDYVPFFDIRHPEESTEHAVSILKNHLKRYPNDHALFCFELVQGEGGAYAGSTPFFTALMHILKEHRIAIFIDEVQTFGRTSRLFAFQHFGLENFVDVVTIGKLSQVCATLYTHAFNPKPGLLSQTFTASSAAIRIGHYIVKELLEGHFFGAEGRIAKIHERFVSHLIRLQELFPNILHGPFGLGGMVAFTVYGGDFKRTTQFIHDLFEAGVIGFIAGTHPFRVRFLVPVGALKDEDIDGVMHIVEEVLKASSKEG